MGRLALRVEAKGQAMPMSARLAEVGLRFGVDLGARSRVLEAELSGGLSPGTITLVTGPSGSGKTLLLNELGRRFPGSRQVGRLMFPLDVAVVDAVAPGEPVAQGLRLLTACGLGEVSAWVRGFGELSEGEQFRARLARAVGAVIRTGGGGPLLCDEFAAGLHRRLARAVAFNLRKLATRERLALVVATRDEDLERELRPDQVIRLDGGCAVARRTTKAASRAGAFMAGELRIEPGKLCDYEAFAAMHYRTRDQLGFVSKVFVLREQRNGESLGVVVYGHPLLGLGLRNRLMGDRWQGRGERLNRELRVLKRLVIHPDVRGCGLGHRLVRETLPLAGTPYVECLAAMGAVNPVFVKAGMRLIGECHGSGKTHLVLKRLQAMGADPLGTDFAQRVCRCPAVRRLVAEAVSDWYRRTTGEGEGRTWRQTPMVLANTFRQMVGSRPVYFMWRRDGEMITQEEKACG